MVVRHWNKFPKEALGAPYLEVLKARLYEDVGTLASGGCLCPQQEGWN